MSRMSHVKSTTIKPSILYYGTPVILLTTLNEDGTVNISPISSSFVLGNHIVLGIGVGGKAMENLERHAECVINLPSPELWEHVERLAPYTGKQPVPREKEALGFTFEKDKYGRSGLTPVKSLSVQPDRIAECPLQMEAKVIDVKVPAHSPYFAIVETEVLHVHAHDSIVIDNRYIDPARWSPLIYNFRHYFSLGTELGKTFRSET